MHSHYYRILPNSGQPLHSHLRGLWCDSHAKCESWQPWKHNLMRWKHVPFESVLLICCTPRQVPQSRMIRRFRFEVHYQLQSWPLTEVARRAINPRHNHWQRSHLFALCYQREREREGGLLSFIRGPLVLVVWPLNLWWAVCVSACVCMPALSAGGWGVREIHSLCWSKKAFNIDSFTHPARGGSEGAGGGCDVCVRVCVCYIRVCMCVLVLEMEGWWVGRCRLASHSYITYWKCNYLAKQVRISYEIHINKY